MEKEQGSEHEHGSGWVYMRRIIVGRVCCSGARALHLVVWSSAVESDRPSYVVGDKSWNLTSGPQGEACWHCTAAVCSLHQAFSRLWQVVSFWPHGCSESHLTHTHTQTQVKIQIDELTSVNLTSTSFSPSNAILYKCDLWEKKIMNI